MELFTHVFFNLSVLAIIAVCTIRWLQSCGYIKSPHPFLSDTAAKQKWTDIPVRNIIQVFLGGLGIRLVLYLAGYAYLILTDRYVPENIFLVFNKWDSYHYVQLIEQGYSGYMENGRHLFLVFFPLYVWMVRPIVWVFGNTGTVGAIFSCVCFALGCCYLYKLAHGMFGYRVARYAVAFISLFPYSFFFGSSMTEGLFFLTVTAAVYYAVRHKWLCFGIWGLLAAMTRMTGVLVMVPAFAELMRQQKPFAPEQKGRLRPKSFFRKVVFMLLPLLGTAVYFLLNQMVDHDPFAFAKHQEHWHQRAMWFTDVLNYAWVYLTDNHHNSFGLSVWYPTWIIFVIFLTVLIIAVKQKMARSSLLLYALVYLIVNYSLSWLLSAGRYMSCGFVFFYAARRMRKKVSGCR